MSTAADPPRLVLRPQALHAGLDWTTLQRSAYLAGPGELDHRQRHLLAVRATLAGRLLRPGQNPGDAVVEEKRREDAIRAAGWGMIRWVWADLSAPAALVARWVRALELGTR